MGGASPTSRLGSGEDGLRPRTTKAINYREAQQAAQEAARQKQEAEQAKAEASAQQQALAVELTGRGKRQHNLMCFASRPKKKSRRCVLPVFCSNSTLCSPLAIRHVA